MNINGQNVEQIVITKQGTGSLVSADSGREVIAILSDDGEWIVKDGYFVEVTAASEEETANLSIIASNATEMFEHVVKSRIFQ